MIPPPPEKWAKVFARWVDETESRSHAVFPPCPHLSCFITSLFPVSRCRRVGALAVFLLSVVASNHSEATTPYLRAVGPVELRFQKRVAYVQPKKLPAPGSGDPIPPEVASGPPPTTTDNTSQAVAPGSSPVAEPVKTEPLTNGAPQAPPVSPPGTSRPILPDTLAPRLVPEEVLPFFILPEARPERSTSSATYKQQ
jgi:hypothetical protein